MNFQTSKFDKSIYLVGPVRPLVEEWGKEGRLIDPLELWSQAARKWRDNEEMKRKWRENEEMESEWLSPFPHSLSISSLSLHFLILSPFPTSKFVTFCRKMLKYGTFVANVTKILRYAL